MEVFLMRRVKEVAVDYRTGTSNLKEITMDENKKQVMLPMSSPADDNKQRVAVGKDGDQRVIVGKDDQGKVPMEMIFKFFPRALEAIATALYFGAKKRNEKNGKLEYLDDWQDRYSSALLRHKIARAKGVEFDDESGLPHLAHEGFNQLALLELWLREHEGND
jgi:hypothetical protein